VQKKNYVGITPDEWETPLYRFTTVERVLMLFNQGKNTLVSPCKWDDPFENLLASLTFRSNDGKTYQHPYRNHIYAQCWTLSKETDATWRIYVPNGNRVRIKTTVQKLHESLYNSQSAHAPLSCYIGKVEYKTEKKLGTLLTQATWVMDKLMNSGPQGRVESLLFKRDAFKSEKEIRLIFLDNFIRGESYLYHYDLDPSDVIMDITFDPRMDDALYETYSSILRKLNYSGKIGKSTLYRIPNIEILANFSQEDD